MNEKKTKKMGRNPKPDTKTHCVMVRFDSCEWNRFLSMYEKSGVYARAVFLKEHFFGRTFKVLTVDKTLVDYYTKLSDFHAQFRAIGTNYNQVVKELRCHYSEKKAMSLLFKLENYTVELVKLSHRIVELSRELEEKWSQKSVEASHCTAHLPTTGRRLTRRKDGCWLPTASTMTVPEW